MNVLHSEIRWCWVLTSADARGVEVAANVYRQRFGHTPALAYVNPAVLADVATASAPGLNVEPDAYLNRALISFALPGPAVEDLDDLRQLALPLVAEVVA